MAGEQLPLVAEPARPTYGRERALVPRSARAELRAVLAEEAAPEFGRKVAEWAKLAGAPLAVQLAFVVAAERAAGGDIAGAYASWTTAAAAARAFLRPPPPSGKARDLERALERSVAAAERCGRCGRWWGLEREGGDAFARLVADRCNGRACLSCTRGRLRKVADRWAPLFGAPVRPGYRLSFVTVGSVGTVSTRADVYAYLRRVGQLCRRMREGAPAFGIARRSWLAGVRALELMPRAGGGWSHVHLTVVRRAFVPYGRHLLPGKGRALHADTCELAAKAIAERWSVLDPRLSVWPCPSCKAHPTADERGFRGLLRAVGLGEVFDDERVTNGGDGARAVAAYVAKLERYVSKVCDGGDGDDGSAASVAGNLTWGGRRDILAAMRGARLLQPFGDALGLLGGRDEVRLYEYGQRVRVLGRELDTYDPTNPETAGVLGAWRDFAGSPVDEIPAAERPEDRRVERVTRYNAAKLTTWRSWCDVDTLRAGMLDGPRSVYDGAAG